MDWRQAFGIGVAGAFVVYMQLYRDSRISEFLDSPSENWKVLVFDVVVYLGCGGLVTVFLVEPHTAKEAFIGGCGWQGFAGSAVAGVELRALRKRKMRRAK
jgi:hypothetical protein